MLLNTNFSAKYPILLLKLKENWKVSLSIMSVSQNYALSSNSTFLYLQNKNFCKQCTLALLDTFGGIAVKNRKIRANLKLFGHIICQVKELTAFPLT